MTTTESKTIPTLPQPLVFNRSMTTSALSKMVLQLQRNHLVVLSGPSGNGKSTFATETLRRYLQNGETEGKNGKEWRTIVTAPFADPIGNLATALARRDALFSEEDVMDRAEIADLLRRDRNALSTLFKRATKNNGRFNFLLIVDQKEELFRYRNILQELGRGDDDIIYVNLLLDAIKAQEEEVAIYIVFVADTRNFHYFAHYRGLPEAMNNFRMELPDLSAAEIGRVLTSYKDQATLIRYREAAQKLAPGDREIAENNLAFFEWLAQQHAFVDRLLFDFKDLSNDEFALQKFNIFLRWVIQECTQSIANIQTEQLLAVYKQLGPMRNVVQNFIEKKVWSQLTPVQKRQTELLFKALTVSTTDKRRPLQWEALAKLVDRDYETHPLLPWTGPKTPFLSKDAQAILSKFNTINEIFFLPRDWDIWPDQVVDINADILIDEWDKVQEWIEQEQKHADIYRDLADAAIAFFSKKEQPAANAPANHTGGIIQRESLWDVVKEWWNNIYPTDQPSFQSAEPHESPYYEGTTLVEALEWIKTQQPNANWAARYDPPASDLQHAQRRAALPPALQDASDWELAQRFLHLSAEQEKLKRDQEEQARQKIMRLQRMSVIGAGVASIACIVALVFWGWAERTNQQVKMVDFVELLEANGCLNISPASHFDKMYELTDFVWKKKLSTEVSVLEYLSKNGALPIDSDHQENKQIAFDALHNIGRLFEEQMGGDTSGHRSLKALQSICARTKQYPEYQFPTVYHALLVHQNTYQYRMPPEHKVSAPKAAIEATALISNPAKWHEYVYGDKNGRIFIRNEKGTDTLPGLDHEIKSIGFSVDGNRLYVGTKKGDLFKYEYSQFHPGFEPRENILTHIKTGDGKPVYFAREWDDQYLLVSNTDQVKIFRRPNPSETNYTEIHSAPIGLSVVRRTDWSSDHKWFFATGQDATIIYQLDPEGAGIKETARITHPNITMTTLAAKIDSLGQVWLALGGEEGTVWLADGKAPALLTKGCEISDSLWFTAYSSVHESSISGLRFNPKYPQMASSDAYGFVYFWNLKYPEADYDRIRVRRRGESITSIVYVNPDELVAFESIHVWELKTNIAALQKEVDNMRK